MEGLVEGSILGAAVDPVARQIAIAGVLIAALSLLLTWWRGRIRVAIQRTYGPAGPRHARDILFIDVTVLSGHASVTGLSLEWKYPGGVTHGDPHPIFENAALGIENPPLPHPMGPGTSARWALKYNPNNATIGIIDESHRTEVRGGLWVRVDLGGRKRSRKKLVAGISTRESRRRLKGPSRFDRLYRWISEATRVPDDDEEPDDDEAPKPQGAVDV